MSSRSKNHTLKGGTSPYSLSMGVPPPRHWGLWFCGFGPFLPRFFGVLDFEARFCGLLQHCGLRLLVLIIGGLWFA